MSPLAPGRRKDPSDQCLSCIRACLSESQTNVFPAPSHPRLWSVQGRCGDRTELYPFASDGTGWGVYVGLTIQTFFMVLFLSTVIIKLVSDGLVQCLTPRLSDGIQRVFSSQEEMCPL